MNLPPITNPQALLAGLPYGTGASGDVAAAAGSWLGPMAARLPTSGLLGKAAGTFAGPLGPAITGYGVSQGINALIPSTTGTAGNVREALADASMGAGVGGTLGTFIGGPGVGTGVGALIGGGLGGAYGLAQDFGLFGGDSTANAGDVRKTIESSATQMGVSPSQYTGAFDLAVKSGLPYTDPATGKPTTTKDPTIIAQILGNQMSQEVTSTRQQKEAAAWQLANHQADLANSLAQQSVAAQYFQPYVNQIISSGQSQADVLNHLATTVPSAYKGVFQAQAASALNNAQQTAGAYMSQMALQPTAQVLQTYQQEQQKELANQANLYKYASQMQSGQGGAGGQVDFSQLGQAAPAPTG
jgi:hypothetical protein